MESVGTGAKVEERRRGILVVVVGLRGIFGGWVDEEGRKGRFEQRLRLCWTEGRWRARVEGGTSMQAVRCWFCARARQLMGRRREDVRTQKE